MQVIHQVEARVYDPGMGEAVANRTINRKIDRPASRKQKIEIPRRDDMALDIEVAAYCKANHLKIQNYHVDKGDGATVSITLDVIADVEVEKWEDVAYRVSMGNAMLSPSKRAESFEFTAMHHHMRQASLIMSGRHLQHGDATQASRNMEVFTNCSTSAMTFLGFYLLLNGSGVGRCYDDVMMQVDWRMMPTVVCVIDQAHPDVQSGEITSMPARDARHLYANKTIHEFMVPDSREGWAQAYEKLEVMTFAGCFKNDVLLLEFSGVRHRGSPIGGMQDRPASGPGPIMDALNNLSKLKNTGMKPWKATMFADHYSAECVLVGGARRAARMATKTWRDSTIFEFIEIKRGGFLWSSNNSVTVDEEFWELVKLTEAPEDRKQLWKHAHKVFDQLTYAAYHDQTGEPGIITVSKLAWNGEGTDVLLDGDFAESAKYKLMPETRSLTRTMAHAWNGQKYKVITNPCVPYETKILTRNGQVQIGSVVGQEVEVWNGRQFSKVTPFHTGFNPTLTVNLSDGTSLRCTPTHKFILAGDRYQPEGLRVMAQDLRIDDRMAKFDMPIILTGESHGTVREAYSQGFYSGDGNTDLPHSWLYSTKYMCADRLIGRFSDEHNSSACKTWTHGLMKAKAWVPVDGDATYCLNWLAGLLDSDGTICTDREGGQSFQITAIDKAFLLETRLMLTRLGVQAKVTQSREGGCKSMPDGRGGVADYVCQPSYRLLINGFDAWTLKGLGLTTTRLQHTCTAPNRSARRFVTVESIVADVPCDTYCFTEPVNHTGTFNGIVTGQCGEIVLSSIGGYCVLGSVVPFHATPDWSESEKLKHPHQYQEVCDDDAEDAFKTACRALIRTNLMDSMYGKEVKRTNRIGVALVGLHEYAWGRFGHGWKDLVNEAKSIDFWLMLSRFKRAIQAESVRYAAELGVVVPHTDTTMVPAGTISKLFGLTEGAHLPAMAEFLRWVQFANGDPLIEVYRAKGYPVKALKVYKGMTIVGFPTQPTICSLGMGDKLVTAAEATPAEQYAFLQLLEKFWIVGVAEDGVTPLRDTGNQVSYTLKYDPAVVSFEEFKQTLLEGQSTIRCCSVMPQTDTSASAYEYLPEQPVTKAEFELIVAAIKKDDTDKVQEDVGIEHVDCASGACPITFGANIKAA